MDRRQSESHKQFERGFHAAGSARRQSFRLTSKRYVFQCLGVWPVLVDRFPVLERKPGPLTLRLRAALVGVDVGGQVAGGDAPADAQPLKQALNIGKVQVEMELVDSITGERIAAMVDRSNLGAGAEVGAVNFSRVEKFAAAREAFDEWASRVREFLDSAHELTGADAERADKSYQPYQ